MPTPAMTQARLRAWLGHPHISTRCAIGAMRRSKDPYTYLAGVHVRSHVPTSERPTEPTFTSITFGADASLLDA
jgi:hypothetical protein